MTKNSSSLLAKNARNPKSLILLASGGHLMCGFQRVVFGVCIYALWLLTAAIYAITLDFAYQTNSFWALLASIFLPYLIDLYWIWHIWSVTGIFFNLLTLLWIGWFGLVAAMTFFTLHADS